MIDKNTTFILFGSTGNLAVLKIWPALCALFERGALGSNPELIAFGRRAWNDKDFCDFVTPHLATFSQDTVARFLSHVVYHEGDLADPTSFVALKSKIKNQNVFSHFSIAPVLYTTVIDNLGKSSINTKLLIEKPFGKNTAEALTLFDGIKKHFNESDVYLVDHYLGKKGLRNIIQRRLTETPFESQINNQHIKQIECRFLEHFGIRDRGEFYDKTGAYLDVGGNHVLLMLLTLLTSIEDLAQGVWGRALTTLHAPKDFVTGQYEGYQTEKGVSKDSQTETYFAFKTTSDDVRFGGVDIILRGGKALDIKKSDVIITWKDGREENFDIDLDRGYNSYEGIFEAVLRGGLGFTLSMQEVLYFHAFNDQVLKCKPLPTIYKQGSSGISI